MLCCICGCCIMPPCIPIMPPGPPIMLPMGRCMPIPGPLGRIIMPFGPIIISPEPLGIMLDMPLGSMPRAAIIDCCCCMRMRRHSFASCVLHNGRLAAYQPTAAGSVHRSET